MAFSDPMDKYTTLTLRRQRTKINNIRALKKHPVGICRYYGANAKLVIYDIVLLVYFHEYLRGSEQALRCDVQEETANPLPVEIRATG